MCIQISSSGIAEFLISIDNILKADCKLSGSYMIICDLNINIVEKIINNDCLNILSAHGFRSFINIYIY